MPSILSDAQAEQLRELSFDPKDKLRRARSAGCYYCLAEFRPDEVREYVNVSVDTPLCPRCEIDGVVPLDGFKKESRKRVLGEMMHRYFCTGVTSGGRETVHCTGKCGTGGKRTHG